MGKQEQVEVAVVLGKTIQGGSGSGGSGVVLIYKLEHLLQMQKHLVVL